MSRKRKYWVDLVKVIACVLIVLGHFYQSMVKANILGDTAFYKWFITTIYHFHTELFFVCSGYLYQKRAKVCSAEEWKNNVLKELIALGVPYLIFSTATWLLKTIFADSVNTAADGLLYTLFIHPVPPYWFLYILFLCFVITPTIRTRDEKYVFLLVAFVMKILQIALNGTGIFSNYIVMLLFAYLFWFVSGMIIAATEIRYVKEKAIGYVLMLCFLFLSVITYHFSDDWISFGLGAIAVTGIVLIALRAKENEAVTRISEYTFSILLMHTLFAAPVRTVLLKIGISHPLVHIIFGMIASFLLPVIAMRVLRKIHFDWIIYPRQAGK